MYPIINAVCYSLATLGLLLGLSGQLRAYKKIWFFLGCLAILLHAWLLHYWIDTGIGQNLTLLNMVSLVAWVIAALILIFAIWQPLESLSLFVFPLAAITILFSAYFRGNFIINTITEPHSIIHIITAITAFSVMCLAAWQAVFLAIIDYLLRSKFSNRLVQHLPPLQTMEKLLFQTIGLAFALLTVVIISSLYFFHAWAFSLLLQKTILVLIAWIIFAILLWGRHALGWRGQRAIYCTLTGTFLLAIVYWGGAQFLGLVI